MWISLSDAFVSIVSDPTDQNLLLVRARRKGDIERVFGDIYAVTRTPDHDYLFRAHIPRDGVAAVIADALVSIDYGNFKGSVKNQRLHDAYLQVWHVMSKLQPSAPYSARSRSRQARLPMDAGAE